MLVRKIYAIEETGIFTALFHEVALCKYSEDKINTFNAQSTLVINMIPGCTASGPLKSLATFS